jgi:signal transduction histidine kinase
MKILIAEDDRASCRLLEATLRKWGHATIAVADGTAAWQVLQQPDPPALAIIDWMMPGLSGVEICRQLRAAPRASPTYLILLTARRATHDVVEGLFAGADDYITKPFEPEELRARIHVGLRMVELQRRLAEQSEQMARANQELAAEVSARQRVEDELRRALAKETDLVELKSRFVAMVSHEFRSPLTLISIVTGLLQDARHGLTDAQRQERLAAIRQAVARMTELLDDVLTISRAEAGRLELHPAPLDVDALCREFVDTIRTVAPTHTTVFANHHPGLAACLDETLLRHTIPNLLSNAVKYSPPGSTVRLELSHEQDEIVFRVADEGIGIPAEDQTRLFETFHRARNVGAVPGTGLGLAIAKRSVELHGGTITFTSQEGAGTTFVVRLPNGRG